jgi:hypothetical protein
LVGVRESDGPRSAILAMLKLHTHHVKYIHEFRRGIALSVVLSKSHD